MFTQTIDLFLNLTGPQYPAQFFTSRFSTMGGSVQFVQGDAALIRLWLCLPPEQAGQPCILRHANGPIAFAIKATASTAAPLLAFASAFTLVDTSEDFTQPHYETVLNLDTNELAAAFSAASDRPLSVRLDIELQSQGNTQRITFAREIQIVPQAFQGSETTPVPAQPAYPAPGDIPSLNDIDNQLSARVAAAIAPIQAAIPGLIATAVQQAVATAVAAIPRPTRATTATLDPSSPATVEILTPDPQTPGEPASQLFAFGVPKGSPGAITSVPAEVTTGTAAISAGATSVTVTFPIAYAALPRVFPSVLAPAGASGEIFATSLTALTATGFTVALSAPAPATGFTLFYMALAA